MSRDAVVTKHNVVESNIRLNCVTVASAIMVKSCKCCLCHRGPWRRLKAKRDCICLDTFSEVKDAVMWAIEVESFCYSLCHFGSECNFHDTTEEASCSRFARKEHVQTRLSH